MLYVPVSNHGHVGTLPLFDGTSAPGGGTPILKQHAYAPR